MLKDLQQLIQNGENSGIEFKRDDVHPEQLAKETVPMTDRWKKDRGEDVESAPWYHLFKGERINDHHLSREEKLTANERN